MKKYVFVIFAMVMHAFSNPVAVLNTTQGEIQIKLFPDVAPVACDNFIKLVESGYYDGTIFHRVIPDFMIQGGDPTKLGIGGESASGKPFKDEFTEKVSFDKPGKLAMANRGPNTNGSQFFITTKETPWLHKRHTIFGEVISGMDIVEGISLVKTNQRDRPLEDQTIIKASIVEMEPSSQKKE